VTILHPSNNDHEESTMRTRRLLILSGLLALGATPIASYAGGSQKAFDACIKNFVETSVPKDRIVRVEKSAQAPGPLAVLSRKKYIIELTARGAKSGEEMSKATCVASPQGYVILLDTKPVDTLFAG
jgi:hypothetical protein